MKAKSHMTAFYIETLLMILVFVGIILALTRIFGQAHGETAKARDLTSAVCLAQNAAEAFAAADSPEAMAELLDAEGHGHVALVDADEDGQAAPGAAAWTAGGLRAGYDPNMTPDAAGALQLKMRWQEENGLVRAQIDVERDGETVYSLETARYGEEAL